jgi:hypothetical protein
MRHDRTITVEDFLQGGPDIVEKSNLFKDIKEYNKMVSYFRELLKLYSAICADKVKEILIF